MTQIWVLDCLCLVLVLICASLVVVVRSLVAAVMAVSAMGTVLGTLFVVGAIATPVLYLIALRKIRTDVVDRGDISQDGGDTGKAARSG